MKLFLLVTLTLLGTAVVYGQWNRGTCSLKFRNDLYSPFYWKGYENICTKSMCETYPWLECNKTREYIMDQAYGHFPEDIVHEITYLKQYFDTMIPTPKNVLPYSCQGACNDNSRQLQLERIFTTLTLENNYGQLETKRWMCLVIGPEIFYQQCGGKCKLQYGRSGNSYCVPDVTVSLDIWVYCPGAEPGCHKVRFDVPLSCTCKKFRCKKDIPPHEDFIHDIPPMPVGWTPHTI